MSDSWRAEFKQADRNKEVREIARVLASLEPGASAGSKLRLAMKFEDSIFHGADNLEDYRGKIKKRLRKLQKNYKPEKKPGETEREKQVEELRQKHGKSITYCMKRANVALKEMKARHGEEKALQLRQHLESVKQWAIDLGLLEKTTPNKNMPDELYEKLKSQIERRLENVRSHVVKLADPEQFFAETLEKAEGDCRGRASRILAPDVQKRYGQIHKVEMKPDEIFEKSMKQATASVPLPTRSQQNDEIAALVWLEKMRSCSTAALAFLVADDKSKMPIGTLTKLHSIAVEGNKFVSEVIKNRRKQQKAVEISLEDAWMKQLQLRTKAEETSANDDATKKKEAILMKPLVARSKLLFTPGRKTPPNLLPVFRMKQATLVRPPPRGAGTHLTLQFGKAFIMTIYFVPLVVRLTAHSETDSGSPKDSECAPWTSFSDELSGRNNLTVWGASGDYASLGHVVEERLRDASAHATRVLRQVFANNTKENASEIETEILEGTALVEFLHLARTTYMPDWKDDL